MQTTLEKGAQNVQRSVRKVVDEIHSTELEMRELENEQARIKLDALNTEAHIRELQAISDQFANEMKARPAAVRARLRGADVRGTCVCAGEGQVD